MRISFSHGFLYFPPYIRNPLLLKLVQRRHKNILKRTKKINIMRKLNSKKSIVLADEISESSISSAVTCYDLSDYITLIEYDTDKNPMDELSFNPNGRFVFILNLRDRVHVLGDNKTVSLPSFYHILRKATSSRVKLKFLNKQHKGCILLCTESYIKSAMKDIDQRFKLEDFYNNEARISRPNLALCERVGEIKEVNKIYHNRLIALGYANIILGVAIKQAIEIKNGTYSHSSTLSNREIQQVQSLVEEIKQNPSYNYSVDYLARKAGISVPKLQTGFKELHQMTVANFIRDIRLQKSEELLKSSDMNVSQIVYSIGFSSRSYFSRIFKGKYNCSPSDYQRQCQLG